MIDVHSSRIKRATVLAVLALLSAAAWAQQDDLLPNGGFESVVDLDGTPVAEHWVTFASKITGISLTSRVARTGDVCLAFKTQGEAGAWQGINTPIPVEGNAKYDFTAYIRNNREDPLRGALRGVLVIEWIDEAGNEVGRSIDAEWNQSLSKMRWTCVELKKHVAPKTAVLARFGIHLIEDGPCEGSFLADDLSVVRH